MKGELSVNKRFFTRASGCAFALALAFLAARSVTKVYASDDSERHDSHADATLRNAAIMIAEGRQTFRFDTFGDEAFWGDTLHLHQAIEGAKNGGVGPGVSPKTALSVGLKADMDALPADLVAQIKVNKIDLDDPATTLALLKLNAVVGVTGFFDTDQKQLKSIGIQCSLCHSTVDDAFAPGIGHRLDGW